MTTPTVTQAIAAVMQEMPAVGKDDRAPQGYTYRGIEAITRVLQPLCAKHGVVIVPSTELLNLVPSPSMKEGWQDLHVAVTWRIYGPAGDHLEATTYGVGRDNSDKGANKAHTQALKYLLLSLFLVADKADDADSIATPNLTSQLDRAPRHHQERPPAPHGSAVRRARRGRQERTPRPCGGHHRPHRPRASW